MLGKTGERMWADPIEVRPNRAPTTQPSHLLSQNSGCYMCNIGGMLMEWTRVTYKSTLHRVCHNSESLHISVPFFFDPNWDALISPVLPSTDGTVGM
jgi:isopenicillin N synthase-like dioxygenase